jgi:endo-1,4-beta-xylanase
MKLSRRIFLGAAASVAAVRAFAADSGLRDLAARKGIIYGAAAASYELKNSAFKTALLREAAMLAPEYEMKRDALERAPNAYDFTGADTLSNFARTNGLKMRGHALLWYRSNPPWLEETVLSTRKENLIADYIAKVAGRYRGRVHSWDVANEILKPSDGRADGLRNDFWMKAFGPAYIDIAFHAARAADPKALLVYNDWGCELGEPANDRFRAATLKFLEAAIARRVPIDALGLQGHLSAFGPQADQEKLRKFLADVKSLGLRILVTEHDVDDSGGLPDIAARDRAVADASRRFLDVVVDNSAADAVLTWGLSDLFIDPAGVGAALTGFSPRKLPLDRAMNRKAMWKAMAAAFA